MAEVQLKAEWNAGLIAASWIVSAFGAATALYVMKQRTGHTGLRNVLLLILGSVAMGSVAIWSMHFVGASLLFLALSPPSVPLRVCTDR